MEENEGSPTIVASGGSMGNIYEMTPFNIQFTGENVSRVNDIKIISYTKNFGVSVDKNKANIKGQYEDTFTFKDNLFYMHEGKHKQASKFSKIEAKESDIYLWIPPKEPEIVDYEVWMSYETSGDEGGTISGEITETLTHIVLPNYTYFAKQVRKLIDIRREGYYGRDVL